MLWVLESIYKIISYPLQFLEALAYFCIGIGAFFGYFWIVGIVFEKCEERFGLKGSWILLISLIILLLLAINIKSSR